MNILYRSKIVLFWQSLQIWVSKWEMLHVATILIGKMMMTKKTKMMMSEGIFQKGGWKEKITRD